MLFCPQPNCYPRQLAYSHHNERRKTLLQFHGFLLWTELKQDRKNEVGLIGLDFDSEREETKRLNSTCNLFQQNPQCNQVWLSFSAQNAEKKQNFNHGHWMWLHEIKCQDWTSDLNSNKHSNFQFCNLLIL